MRARGVLAVIVWGAGLAQAGVGCSSILGIESDRHLVSNASDGGYASDAKADAQVDPWACLGQPVPGSGHPDPLDITLVVMDGLQPETSAGGVDGGSDLVTVNGAYLPGITVRACDLLDPGCTMPSATVVTDGDGRAIFALPQTFGGFFRMDGMLSGEPAIPVSLYPGPLTMNEATSSLPGYELSEEGLQILTGSLVQTPLALGADAGAGHLLVNVYDCMDHQGAGVSFSYSNLGSGAQPFYFSGGLPSTTGTETDGYGLGGAINVPLGAQTITAKVASSGTVVGSTAVVIRPGEITWAWIRGRAH
jgi:hypothetical protein